MANICLFYFVGLSLSQVAAEMSVCLLSQEQALLNLMEKGVTLGLYKAMNKYPDIKAVYSTISSKDLHVLHCS